MTGMTDMMKKAVIVYGAGISGRGAAAVLAQLGRQVFLYKDNPCTIDDELLAALQAAGGALVIGEEAFTEAAEEQLEAMGYGRRKMLCKR